MICPNCGTTLDDDATECYVCGYRLVGENQNNIPNETDGQVVCPTCGYVFDEPASVCPVCGTAIDISEFNPNETENVDELQEPINETAEDTEDLGGGNEKEEGKTDHPKQTRNIFIVVIVVAVLILCIIAAFFLLGDNEEEANDDEDVAILQQAEEDESEELSEEESANIRPDSSFIGYWNIKGDLDTELAITNITGSVIEFSLYWYRNYEINDVTATLNDDNIATFSDSTDGFIIAGTFTFYEDMVSVKITESNIDTIQLGTMIFDEKHSPAWYYGTTSDYAADTGLGTDDYYGDYGEYYYGDGNDDGFILPESDYELLTYDDIAYLSSEELRLARNEIYARHGRRFDDASIQAYFDSCWWYEGTIDPDDFSDDMLNDIEKENVRFIKSYE